MSRDVLDITGKASSLADPMAPFPGNLNTMDPAGWDNFLWTDVSDVFGADLYRAMARSGKMSGSAAMGLSIAIQCADVHARALQNAEIRLWRELEDMSYRRVRPSEHWFARMLARRPNRFHTWTQVRRMIGMHFALLQNAYLIKDIQRDGTIIGLLPYTPTHVTKKTGDDNRMYYECAVTNEYERALFGLPVTDQGVNVLLPESRVIHLTGRMWNGIDGVSNLILAHPTIDLINTLSDYQKNLFGNSGTVVLAFETDQAFTGDMADAAFRRLKEQLATKVRKSSVTGEPILLEAGLKAKQIAVNARDSMTSESFRDLIDRVCGVMATPPHKIYAYYGVKYDNMATSDNQWVNEVIKPMALTIEESLRNGLFTDDELDELYPEFDRMELMAGDMKTLGDTLDKFVRNGVLSINETRERLPLALNPIPGGDVRTVPVNVAMVDEDGTVTQQAASGQTAGTPNPANPDATPNQDAQQGRSLRVVSTND